MQMPEGFNLFEQLIRKLASDNEEGLAYKIADAGDLMKEMAEALEKGIKHEDCPKDGPCRIYGHDEMRAALKKFRDWK